MYKPNYKLKIFLSVLLDLLRGKDLRIGVVMKATSLRRYDDGCGSEEQESPSGGTGCGSYGRGHDAERCGPLISEPYESGEGSRYDKLSTVLSGAAVTALAGRRSRAAAIAGGTMVLAGAALERWSVFKSGFQSARDPKYTVIPQRERLRERDGTHQGG
jgi:hypothetical protein